MKDKLFMQNWQLMIIFFALWLPNCGQILNPVISRMIQNHKFGLHPEPLIQSYIMNWNWWSLEWNLLWKEGHGQSSTSCIIFLCECLPRARGLGSIPWYADSPCRPLQGYSRPSHAATLAHTARHWQSHAFSG